MLGDYWLVFVRSSCRIDSPAIKRLKGGRGGYRMARRAEMIGLVDKISSNAAPSLLTLFLTLGLTSGGLTKCGGLKSGGERRRLRSRQKTRREKRIGEVLR